MVRILLLTWCLVLGTDSRILAQNFKSDVPRVTEAAEHWREQLSVFWTGDKLPDWNEPVPIRILPTSKNTSGGGATRFIYDGGVTRTIDMTICGSDHQIMYDILPHEVNHTIIHSIANRPVERWLDEGLSTLFETQETKKKLFDLAKTSLNTPGSVIYNIDNPEYPQGQEIQFYTTSYALTEFLLTKVETDVLLEIAADPRKSSVKLEEYVGYDTLGEFRKWILESSHEPYIAAYNNRALVQGLPTLYVITSGTCAPCHAFWFDLRTDRVFASEVFRRVNIVAVDVANGQEFAKQGVPAYVLNGKIVFVGYHMGRGLRARKTSFMSALDTALRGAAQTPQTPTPSQVIEESVPAPAIPSVVQPPVVQPPVVQPPVVQPPVVQPPVVQPPVVQPPEAEITKRNFGMDAFLQKLLDSGILAVLSWTGVTLGYGYAAFLLLKIARAVGGQGGPSKPSRFQDDNNQ